MGGGRRKKLTEVLRYQLTWSKASDLFKELRKKGVKLGDGARKVPRLSPLLQLYYQAFLDLNRRRQHGMSGPQPLTYQEIAAYIGLKFRMPPAQINSLVTFLEKLDDAYLEHCKENQK